MMLMLCVAVYLWSSRSSGDSGPPDASGKLVRACVLSALLRWDAHLRLLLFVVWRPVPHLVACCPLCSHEPGTGCAALSWTICHKVQALPATQKSLYTFRAIKSEMLLAWPQRKTVQFICGCESVRPKLSFLPNTNCNSLGVTKPNFPPKISEAVLILASKGFFSPIISSRLNILSFVNLKGPM